MTPRIVLDGFPTVADTDPHRVHRAAVGLMSEHRMSLPPRTREMSATIRAAQLDRTALMFFEYGVEAGISSAPLDGYSTLHLPLRGTIDLETAEGRHRVGAGAGIVFSHGRPVRMRWSVDLRLLVARFDHAALMGRLASMLGEEARSPLVFDPIVRAGAGADSVASIVLATERLLAGGGRAVAPMVVRELEGAAMSALLLTHPHSLRGRLEGPAPLASPRVVRAVVEHIESRFADELTAADLAAVGGVSERSLHTAFQRRFGTTPVRYLRAHRYAEARRRLAAGAAPSVAAAAHGVGIHHLGRFAAEYRERYGETPAETLRRASG